MLNREKLWNAVEAVEQRKDAQLAREFNFALPCELTLKQNIALARDFVSQGMIADLCIHNDKTSDRQLQLHAHMILTLRKVMLDGFGQKVRAWNAKENLLVWRDLGLSYEHLSLHG